MAKRAFDGHWLRARITAATHYCGRCHDNTRHRRWIDAIGLVYAKCGMCGEWNEWV